MGNVNKTNLRIWLALLVATVAFGCCVHGWLTDPIVSQGLWPADVQRGIVAMGGGSSAANAVGDVIHEISVGPLVIRIGGIIGLLCLGLAFGCRRATKVAVRQTTTLFAASCLWWLIWLPGDLGFAAAAQWAVGIAPLWISATCGTFCWIWLAAFLCPGTAAAPSQKNARAAVGVLWVAMVGWVVVSFWMNFCLYEQLLIPHGDSAMYEEHLWNMWHGKGFRSYLDQGLFLGEHVQVIHLLLLPLHMFWPSHLLLELAESMALASCAIPIFRMTRRTTGSAWAGTFLGMAWLLYFPMHFLDIAIDQKTFRPIALGLPFLFWLVEYIELKKYWAALVCLVLALSAKEDMALITFPLLTVLAIRAGNRTDAKWPAMMALGSVVYLVVVVLLVIPWFRAGEVVHYSRYFGDLGNSPGELVKTGLREPGRVIAQALTVQTLLYVFVFLLPLAFLPVRRLLCLAAGVLTFGMLSLLQFGDNSGLPPVPYHHFHAPLLVVVFWAAICGLPVEKQADRKSVFSRLWDWLLLRRNDAVGAAGLVLCLCAATGLTGSMMPFGVAFWSQESSFSYQRLYAPTDAQQQERAAMVDEVLAVIPMNARVASTDFIHTRLTHREKSYDYSSYLRKVNNYQPGVPADTDYIVIDTRHKYSKYRSAADVPELNESDDWELLPDTTNGAFLILRRK